MEWLERLRAALAQLLNGPSMIATPPTRERTVSVGGDVKDSQISTGDTISISLAIDAPRAHAPLHQLPADAADFAGRGVELEKLLGVLRAPGGRAAITAIDGMGGLGKTTLAVHVAHRLTGRYPNGQIVVSMEGTSAVPLSPAQGLARIIRAFEPLKELPDTVTDLRPIYLHVLRGKRVLLILDNAFDGDQVAPLLPPEDCGLIVTSRQRIAVAGLLRVDLDLLAPDEASGLLRSIVGDDRATPAELTRITELCGLLPLALRVAGMFLVASPHWSAERFIAALADERKRLARLKLDGSAQLDVAASLALSVRELRWAHPNIADLWHELAVFPASFDTAGAAAVWGQPEEAANDALGVLLSRSVVLYDPTQQRWRLHDLMRDLAGGDAATEALGAPADLAARLSLAGMRHAAHYCGVLAAADDLYLNGGDQVLLGLALFDRERRNIETGRTRAVEAAADNRAAGNLCARYPLVGANMLALRQHHRERIAWLQTAATTARQIGDRGREGRALGNLGLVYKALGDTRRAIEHEEQVLLVARETGDRHAEGQALHSLGNSYVALGEPDRAIEYCERALAIMRDIGDRRGEGHALCNLGYGYKNLGDLRHAIEHYEKALALMREIGDLRNEGYVLGPLGDVYAALGDIRRAIEHYDQVLLIMRKIGDRGGEGAALGSLGNCYMGLGEPRRAIELLRKGLDIFEAIESPYAAEARAMIAELQEEGRH